MTCRHVAQLRDVYLDGELSPSLTAELHAHLLQCPACQQQFEMFRACGEVIEKDRPAPTLDSGFASRVLGALPRTHPLSDKAPLPTRRDRRRRLWRLVASTSVPAAAAVIFFSVLIWPTGLDQGQNVPGRVLGKSVTATDATAVDVAVQPALEMFSKTGRAAESLSGLTDIVVDEARQRVEDAASEEIQPESALLDVLLSPFRDVLHPVEPEETPNADDEEIVRF